ncbi:MAG: malto-oligosyltrehalose synthase [Nocardioidaceae bacterium]
MGDAPHSTYRLQLHRGFGFAAAAAVVGYLSRLGVSHLYLSPVLQATPGSAHGYDVVDHSRIAPDLGGEGALVALADEAHRNGLGLVVDVVPNHMALPTPAYLNRQLWQTLRLGRKAPTAHWFDVDWEAQGGRFGLPVVSGDVESAIAGGELRLGSHDGEQVVLLGDQVLPVAPGTGGKEVAAVLERQHWLLAPWRDKAKVLNYRRFFDVDTLVAIRVEDADVFAASHALLLDLHRRGVLDGFRIDHPDGLADPQEYLRRLAEATDGAWVVAEKILSLDEQLPTAWDCAGTTGYDAIRAVQSAWLPPTGDELTRLWTGLGGDRPASVVEEQGKRAAAEQLLAPEVDRLLRVVTRVVDELDTGSVPDPPARRDALIELLAAFDVYRAYVRPGECPAPGALDPMSRARAIAAARRPDLSVAVGWWTALLTDHERAGQSQPLAELVTRFQQTCGPVLAKGVEDTAFYRMNRLVALNEVGGDLDAFDRAGADHLHRWAVRQAEHHPYGMSTLSTHDTKRSEDVRAQLLAAAEDPDAWDEAWQVVRGAAGLAGVDEPAAYLVFQTLLGAWPLDEARVSGYLRKALREAKQRTSWTKPDEDYEQRVLGLARAGVAAGEIRDAVCSLVRHTEPAERAVVLGTKLAQLTMPGVPDVYQGCESLSRTLVDPDNRRPVDHRYLAERLERLDAGMAPADLADAKLLVTSRALRLRRRIPGAFAGDHVPWRNQHLVGFVRGGRVLVAAVRLPQALAAAGGWQDRTVTLPDGRWCDELTGAPHHGEVRLASLFAVLPVSLLVRG